MKRAMASQKELVENPLRKPVNTLAIVPTKSSKITVLARKAYNVLLYIAQEQGIEQEVFRAPLQSILRGVDFNSNAREIVKQHLRAMVSTTVEWQSPTAGRVRPGTSPACSRTPRFTSSPARTGSNGPLRPTSSMSCSNPSDLLVCDSTSSRSYGVIPAWCSMRSAPDIAT